MEKLAQFGVEPVLLAAQIINFIILLLILKHFLYKPILIMLRKRKEKIREGLAAGEKGEALLVRAKEEEKEVLSKANNEARLMLEETRDRSQKMEEEVIFRAKEETEHMVSLAKDHIGKERKRVERELEKKAALVGLYALERILPKLLSKQDQIRILEGSEKLLRKTLPS